jgi:hypothetical protein
MPVDRGRDAAIAALGLGPGADDTDIRIAYRRLAMRYHPDVSGDPRTAKRFARVVRAYKVLTASGSASGAASGLSRGGSSAAARTSYRSVEAAGSGLFALGQLLASEPEAGARAAAARALGLSGRTAAYVFLRRALYDPSPQVALEAVRAMALLGTRQAEGEVAALYSRSVPGLRRKILELAGATGERLFRSTLEVASKDQDPGLRALAKAAGLPERE